MLPRPSLLAIIYWMKWFPTFVYFVWLHFIHESRWTRTNIDWGIRVKGTFSTLAEKSIGPLGFFVIGLFVSLKKAACAPYVDEQSLFYLSIMFKSFELPIAKRTLRFYDLGPFLCAKQFKTAKTIASVDVLKCTDSSRLARRDSLWPSCIGLA